MLALLKDRPMHGYEMIQEIAERSGGAWKPSPGSVYPTLQLLEDEGLIASETEGGKRLFSLTEAGREAAESGPEAPWEEASRGVDWEALGEIRQAGFGLMEAFGQVWKTGNKDQRDKALTVINDARKKLYLILADED
ncbi:DNA-binding transcriptional regulator, PadR family [Streptomyces sp. PAN_FS17]|nr:DNA-binding transcriptional regulator, PadR family [Streptomyces sp. PAN_FS17]